MQQKQKFTLKITHIPTGLSARSGAAAAWTEHRARLKALRALRAKVGAHRRGIGPADDQAPIKKDAGRPVAVYELPDDTPYPDDLAQYRKIKIDMKYCPITGNVIR